MQHLDYYKNLDSPAFYNNREISWLSFNQRVLEEASDKRNPLIERLKFIAIFSSNLDEFFMVRVGRLKNQAKVGYDKTENKTGLTPKQQLQAIAEKNHQLVDHQYKTFSQIHSLFHKQNIYLTSIDMLHPDELDTLEEKFDEFIYPVLTPRFIDAYQAFPMLANKSTNLLVVLEDKLNSDIIKKAIVQVPALLNRFFKIGDSHRYILIEDVITHFIYKIFQGYHINSITEFRITRNADFTIHEEGDRDLLADIDKVLKRRKWGSPVRLETRHKRCDTQAISFLRSALEMQEEDIYCVHGPIDFTFLNDFVNAIQADHEQLIYQKLIPQPTRDIYDNESVFDAALKRDIFLHHPYESFQPVIDLIKDAAEDSDVVAIKQTLYRVSEQSPIIKGLKRAAKNGKRVTVLVELKARFDEEKNMHWSKKLERAGCHVIYGMHFLKTHSKITLIVRKRLQKIERFVHLSTGNYNDSTAVTYTDMGLITTKRSFGIDATNFFNYLSGVTEKPQFNHLSMAPFDLRNDFLHYINKEVQCHKENGSGHIIAKMNSLTDKLLIKTLYKASQVGVKINLIVRGICCLKPGIKDVSENITVRSIVGRFLEHSRIFYFYHNGEERIFLSSADMMTRNMDKRVELLFPIYERSIKNRIKKVLDVTLKDNLKAREQQYNGSYTYVQQESNQHLIESQTEIFTLTNYMKKNKK